MITFGYCALGDVRRTKRLVDYAAREASRLGRSTTAACEGDAAAAEGAYRLMRNNAVNPDDIAEGGFQATVRAAQECGTLLAIEDSSTLEFLHSVAGELGDLGGPANSKSRGFWVHSTLLVDAATARTIGLIDQQRWTRTSERIGQGRSRKHLPREEIESEKWSFSSKCTTDRLGEKMPDVISVCDREADYYAYMAFKRSVGQRFIIRARYDRRLADGDELWARARAATKLGTAVFEITQRGSNTPRAKREAELVVRSERVVIKPPHGHAGAGDLAVTLVHARDEASDAEDAIEWLLLTTEDASTIEDAVRVLGYYRLRWRIEDFHKAWKSGCHVEKRRMQTPENIERIAVVLAFVAVRLLQLRDEAGCDPEQPCTSVFTEHEWRCLYVLRTKKKPPKKTPTLRWALDSIARLGGFLDTKRTGRPGWDALWKGWLRLQDMVTFRDALGEAGLSPPKM